MQNATLPYNAFERAAADSGSSIHGMLTITFVPYGGREKLTGLGLYTKKSFRAVVQAVLGHEDRRA